MARPVTRLPATSGIARLVSQALAVIPAVAKPMKMGFLRVTFVVRSPKRKGRAAR